MYIRADTTVLGYIKFVLYCRVTTVLGYISFLL